MAPVSVRQLVGGLVGGRVSVRWLVGAPVLPSEPNPVRRSARQLVPVLAFVPVALRPLFQVLVQVWRVRLVRVPVRQLALFVLALLLVQG